MMYGKERTVFLQLADDMAAKEADGLVCLWVSRRSGFILWRSGSS